MTKNFTDFCSKILVVIAIATVITVFLVLDAQENIEEDLINSISIPKGSDVIRFEYTVHDNGWYFCEIMVERPVRICTSEEKRLEPWKCKDVSVMQSWCDYWRNLDTNMTHQVAGTFNSSTGIAWWDEK